MCDATEWHEWMEITFIYSNPVSWFPQRRLDIDFVMVFLIILFEAGFASYDVFQ